MTASSISSIGTFWRKISDWAKSHPYWFLTIITVSVLAPFLTKPFNIDDPLFLWMARQIQSHPANPYGFDVNWYGVVTPFWQAMENPPLAGYYLAGATGMLGWSEFAVHLALLPAAVAVILGTYRLAVSYCKRPLLATCVTLFTPVFLVSSTTVMCDIMMLAFWVWAIVFWLEGMKHNSFACLITSGLFMTCAALTKYFGIALIPLLLAYGFLAKRKPGSWLMVFLIPIAALVAYQIVTKNLYGHGLLSGAGLYSAGVRNAQGFSTASIVLIALAFTGGCLATVVFFAPLLWTKRMLLVLIALGTLTGIFAIAEVNVPVRYVFLKIADLPFYKAQIIFWVTGGICTLALVVADAFKQRDPFTWLLVLWVGGTFIFAGFFNWTVSGRTILPMAPAAGILLAARLDRVLAGKNQSRPGIAICLAAGALLALLVTRADFMLAKTVRLTAQMTHERFAEQPARLSFAGHWGFQYYMESYGHLPVVGNDPDLKPGNFLAVPANNTNFREPDPQKFEQVAALRLPVAVGVSTWNKAGGGFYASAISPLPFAFGHMVPEEIIIYGPISTGGDSATTPLPPVNPNAH